MFLILAWVIISCPFRMPPKSSPMMTSTIAISTKVKPPWVEFLLLIMDELMLPAKPSGVKNPLKPARYVPDSMPVQPRFTRVDQPFLLNNGYVRRFYDPLLSLF